ncbi:NAD-dependent epimerase/dehydratase family protein [Deinococcus aetherius]|uniref:NAD-dependent epimerase/dehydratase family protein n=1 Tax=Deinococcus aetherius TaxID=200252 RepID=UPI00223223ED|nr:NAD(P)-dependent oxidoreductase [Deinococcus aetherius]
MLVTGATGNAGSAVCAALAAEGHALRLADVTLPGPDTRRLGEVVRCDLRTPEDARRVVDGVDAVIHLAAWHSGHVPPVSDPTLFSVNVDGTFHLLQACREAGAPPVVFGSSMAHGFGDVYGLTKVLGEDLCRGYHHMTGAAVVMLRYHAFVPGPYLEYGARLLRNGVDRRDVVSATLAALAAVRSGCVTLFTTVVHSDHGMPPEVRADFRRLGPAWCEAQLPGSRALLKRYGLDLPERVEQHDLSGAAGQLGWRPQVTFLDFLRDLARRDARGEDVRRLTVPGELPGEPSP